MLAALGGASLAMILNELLTSLQGSLDTSGRPKQSRDYTRKEEKDGESDNEKDSGYCSANGFAVSYKLGAS
jgi:hypothetical protein